MWSAESEGHVEAERQSREMFRKNRKRIVLPKY